MVNKEIRKETKRNPSTRRRYKEGSFVKVDCDKELYIPSKQCYKRYCEVYNEEVS